MRILIISILFAAVACSSEKKTQAESTSSFKSEVEKTLRKQVMEEAAWALLQEPITVTA